MSIEATSLHAGCCGGTKQLSWSTRWVMEVGSDACSLRRSESAELSVTGIETDELQPVSSPFFFLMKCFCGDMGNWSIAMDRLLFRPTGSMPSFNR